MGLTRTFSLLLLKNCSIQLFRVMAWVVFSALGMSFVRICIYTSRLNSTISLMGSTSTATNFTGPKWTALV